MARRLQSLGALLLLVLVVAFAMGAKPQKTKVTKQEGGSTGDSVVAADTSDAIFIREDATGLWMNALNDSATIYYLDISPDTTSATPWVVVDSMVVAKGWGAASTDLGKKWPGYWVRVRAVCDSASTSAWGRHFVTQERPE